VNTNLLRLVRNAALSAALAAILGFGPGNLHRITGTTMHALAPHMLLVDGVETHGGKNPPPKNA